MRENLTHTQVNILRFAEKQSSINLPSEMEIVHKRIDMHRKMGTNEFKGGFDNSSSHSNVGGTLTMTKTFITDNKSNHQQPMPSLS